MKKIILVAAQDAEKSVAKVGEIYAQNPDQNRIVRTRVELQTALASGHTAIMNTLPAVLEVRSANLREAYRNVELEVVDLDA